MNLHDVARADDLPEVKPLLKDRPDLVFSTGGTPLHWAAKNGHASSMDPDIPAVARGPGDARWVSRTDYQAGARPRARVCTRSRIEPPERPVKRLRVHSRRPAMQGLHQTEEGLAAATKFPKNLYSFRSLTMLVSVSPGSDAAALAAIEAKLTEAHADFFARQN
jgi:hypothetical protein